MSLCAQIHSCVVNCCINHQQLSVHEFPFLRLFLFNKPALVLLRFESKPANRCPCNFCVTVAVMWSWCLLCLSISGRKEETLAESKLK